MSHTWSAIQPDSQPPPRRQGLALAAGFALLAVAFAAEWILYPGLADLPYGLVAPATLVALLIGGLVPGLAVGLPGLAGSFVFQLAHGEPQQIATARFLVAISVWIILCLLAEAYHRAWRRAAIQETVLRTREAHLRTVVGAVPDAIVVFDKDGSIVSFNEAAETMFGMPVADALGSDIDDLVPPHLNSGRRLRESAEAISGGSGARLEVKARRPSGQEFAMDARLALLPADSRALVGLFGVDLTPIRAAALREAAVVRQLARAWRLNSMGEMASILAHEVSQPLAASLSYLDAARELLADSQPGAARLASAIDLAVTQAHRAASIVRGLHKFVERGTGEQNRERISDILEETASMLKLSTAGRSVDLAMPAASGLPDVKADRVQIQQVVLNLVRNAIEAMDGCEHPRIVIESYLEDGMVIVAVSDSGPGADAEVLDRYMQPYFSGKEGGMGVGLSISKAIMDAHKGFIRMTKSELGGARFEIGLPVFVEEGPAT